MKVETAKKITVKNENGTVALDRDDDSWYVTYEGEATSNYYTSAKLQEMIDNGDVYGDITFESK